MNWLIDRDASVANDDNGENTLKYYFCLFTLLIFFLKFSSLSCKYVKGETNLFISVHHILKCSQVRVLTDVECCVATITVSRCALYGWCPNIERDHYK